MTTLGDGHVLPVFVLRVRGLLDFLGARYESIGIQAEGRSHSFDFQLKADSTNEVLVKVV